MQINIKGYNDADKNKGGLLPDLFLLPPILNNQKIQNALTTTLRNEIGRRLYDLEQLK